MQTHTSIPRPSASAVMRGFDLPSHPTLEDKCEGWCLYENGTQQAAHTVTDAIMSSQNGSLGVKGNTDLGENAVINHVLVGGTFQRVREDHPAPSISLPKYDEHLPEHLTLRITVVDENGATCTMREMHHRILDLRSGVTEFQGTLSSGSVSVGIKWCRFASLVNLDRWMAHLQLTHIEGGDQEGTKFTVHVDLEFESWLWRVVENEANCDAKRRASFDALLLSSGVLVSTLSTIDCHSSDTEICWNVEKLSTISTPLVKSPKANPKLTPGLLHTFSSPSSSEIEGTLPPAASTSNDKDAPKAPILRHRRSITVTLGEMNSEIEFDLCFETKTDSHERSHDAPTFEAELTSQKRILSDNLWAGAALKVSLQDDHQPNRLLVATRFSQYSLFCNGIGCSKKGIHKNGLSHTGSHGQISFQDYLYLGMYYCLTNAVAARALVEHLYASLPYARRLSAKLVFAKGALFPFTTISGEECGSYFLNSTARFHVNADLGYVVSLFLEIDTHPKELQMQCLELLLETARVWLHLGQWQDGHTVFTIDDVSGPDAYNGLESKNFYTNLSARRHMLNAHETFVAFSGLMPAETKELLERIEMPETEVHQLQEAAEGIVLHRDDRTGIYFAHEHFESQPCWPTDADATRYPLSVNYHPLVIYRHKVCELPEVLLGMLLMPERFERSDLRKNLQYYEKLCTCDNPMSLAIITALKFRAWGDFGKGTKGFQAVVQMDTENLLPVSDEGLHLSAMTGGWFVVAFGVCKMKVVKSTLHLSPDLPVGWESCVLDIHWRSAVVRVTVEADNVTYELVKGPSARFVHFETTRVHLYSSTQTDASVAKHVSFPRLVRQQVTAHFDGVIFTLESIVANLRNLHYCAWRNSLERFFDEIRLREGRDIPELSMEEYVEKVLYQVEQSDLLYTGLAEILKCRGIDLELGNPTDAEIVETRFGLANAKLAEMSELLRCETELQLVEGVKDLLVDLRRLGLRVAVVSYTRSMAEVLKALPILSSLSTTSIDGVEAREKKFAGRPHTDLFEKAAKKMHLPSDRCVVIGSEFDRGYNVKDFERFHVFIDVARQAECVHDVNVSKGSHSPLITVQGQKFPSSVAVLEDWIMDRHASS